MTDIGILLKAVCQNFFYEEEKMAIDQKKSSVFWTVFSVCVLFLGVTLTVVMRRDAVTPTGMAIGDGIQGPNIFNAFVRFDGIDGG